MDNPSPAVASFSAEVIYILLFTPALGKINPPCNQLTYPCRAILNHTFYNIRVRKTLPNGKGIGYMEIKRVI
jgi:hypothetical protein